MVVLVDQVTGALQYPCPVVCELRLFGRMLVTFIVNCSVLAGSVCSVSLVRYSGASWEANFAKRILLLSSSPRIVSGRLASRRIDIPKTEINKNYWLSVLR